MNELCLDLRQCLLRAINMVSAAFGEEAVLIEDKEGTSKYTASIVYNNKVIRSGSGIGSDAALASLLNKLIIDGVLIARNYEFKN